MQDNAAGALGELWARLWRDTLENALKSPFYRMQWASLDVDQIAEAGPEAIRHLPMVTRGQLAAAGAAARTLADTPCYDVVSSGTTGAPLLTRRSRREMQFLGEFFGSRRNSECQPRGLCFVALYHGTQVAIPVDCHVHRINIYDAAAFEYAISVLRAEHDDPGVERRCRFISGQERVLNALCLELERLGDGGGFALEFAFSQGGYVGDSVRTRIERSLSCRLVDRFSLSEVFGGPRKVWSPVGITQTLI